MISRTEYIVKVGAGYFAGYRSVHMAKENERVGFYCDIDENMAIVFVEEEDAIECADFCEGKILKRGVVEGDWREDDGFEPPFEFGDVENE